VRGCGPGCLLAAVAFASPAAAAETVGNAAGRYDALALRDLGGKQAAIVQLVAANGSFTPVELWRSKKGAYDVRKAIFVAGDVNGDGIGDGIVLYDLGHSLSPGCVYQQRSAGVAQDRLDLETRRLRQGARQAGGGRC